MKIMTKLTMAVVAAGLLTATAAVPAFAKAKSCKTLNMIDPDNDGAMTLAEAKTRANIVFDKLNKDRDKDSTLDLRELQGRLSKKDFAAANPDKDGTLDKAEYAAVVEARFNAANPDKDATIECKELKSKAGKALLKLLK